MADNPWSNKQQQMVQEYLDALLTDPDAAEETEQLAADSVSSDAIDTVLADDTALPADDVLGEDVLPEEPVTEETCAEELVAEELVADEARAEDLAVEELSVTDAADSIRPVPDEASAIAGFDDVNDPAEMAESESHDSEMSGAGDDKDIQQETVAEAAMLADEDDLAEPVEMMEAATQVDDSFSEPEEALDAALHAIESVKAAEAAESEEHPGIDDVEQVEEEVVIQDDNSADLLDDCTAEDGVSTINDPISVAAELLHEELDHFDAAEDSAEPFVAADIDPFDDIPVLTAGMETVTESAPEASPAEPEEDDSLTAAEDLAGTEANTDLETADLSEKQADDCEGFDAEFESQQVAAFPADDLEAYVNDINGVADTTASAPTGDSHEMADEQDIAALLSQLAEIVSDASVAEAVIRKVEEIAAEFSVSDDSAVISMADQQLAEPVPDEIAVDEALVDEALIEETLVDEAMIEEALLDEAGADEAEAEVSAEDTVTEEISELADPDEAIEFPLGDDFMTEEEIAAGFMEAEEEAATEQVAEPVAEVIPEPVIEPAPVAVTEPAPAEDLQCIIVDMHGLQLAMPLQHVLEPRHIADMSLVLDDQYDWVLGSFLDLNFKVDVVDTAMWLIPERYEPHNATYDEILLLQDKPWALTYDRMITAQIISMDDITLNTDKTRRPWLMGTSMTHKCAVVDIPALCKQLEEAL